MPMYIVPAEGRREYLKALAPHTDKHDLIIVTDSWTKQIAHQIIDPVQPDPAGRVKIRVVGTRKARHYARRLAQQEQAQAE